MEQAFALPPLRQELRIEPGAPLASGEPGFILFDPLRHLFFQLGALERRAAAHWRRGEAGAVRDALVAEGADGQEAEDALVAFHEFALANSLLREPGGDATAAFAARHAAARRDWWRWLLDHYLFIRVPLVRPAAFLERTLPFVRPIWSPTGIAVLAALALIGLYLIAGRWDAFSGSFAGLLTGPGLGAWAAALLFVKACHELGHAYMATRFGCRVPAMGVSFLVMLPVLYTDTSAAWRLRSRRERMLIGAAGVLAELSVAAVALFLWPFLPDGPARTVAFVLATTSLATTLLVNASPFMRFDGYYILSDLLGVPNLAARGFALLRWRVREALFALGEPAPEELPTPLRRAMLAYAGVTLAYRAALYVGIALLVYHSFFKTLGVVLFLVEMHVFLVRPVLSELKEWRRRGAAIRASRRARVTAAASLCVIAACFLPLDRSVSVPAVLSPIGDRPAVLGEPARVERVLVRSGQEVAAGQPLLILSSPDLTLGVAQAELRIAQLRSRLARGVADRLDLADATVLARDLAAERERLEGLRRREAALTVRSEVAGRVVDLADHLQPGVWTDGREPLLRVVTPGLNQVRAFADDGDRWRLTPGVTGRFIPDGAATGATRVRLDEVAAVATRTLDEPVLAAANGGPLPATRGSRDEFVSNAPLAPLRLVAERGGAVALPQPVTGRVVLPARGDSMAAAVTRGLGRVLAAETAF